MDCGRRTLKSSREPQVSQRGPSSIFASKEDLCMEIFDREETIIAKEVEAILSRHRDAAEAFRAVL
jgi:hypothetical protein